MQNTESERLYENKTLCWCHYCHMSYFRFYFYTLVLQLFTAIASSAASQRV